MYNQVGRQMQQDRTDGIAQFQMPDERGAYLAALGAANARPPLPVSPCVIHRVTGEIHEWSQAFADRPDLVANCDEYGNTDPATWQGRAPAGMTRDLHKPDIYAAHRAAEAQERAMVRAQMPQQGQPAVPAPPGLMFFYEEFESGPTPGAVPQVAMAPALLGIPANFTQDYTDPVTTKAALPFAGVQGYGNQTVGDVVAQRFSQTHF